MYHTIKYKKATYYVSMRQYHRNLILTAFLGVFIFLSTGCSQYEALGTTTNRPHNDGLIIETSIFPLYDFTRIITSGANAQVSMLLPPGVDMHGFEPTPADIMRLGRSDLLIYIGGHSEVWVNRVSNSMPNLNTIALMHKLGDCEHHHCEHGEHHCESGHHHCGHVHHHCEHNHNHGHHHNDLDEHIWVSLRNAKAMVQIIADELSAIDPANAHIYQENAIAYIAELSTLYAEFHAMRHTAQRDTIIFGDRFPFVHLANELNLNFYAAFPGCVHSSEPSIADMIFLIDTVRTNDIPIVFYVAMSNGRIANTIAEETNATLLTMHGLHTVPLDDFNNGISYLYLMRHNLEVLRVALH